jgi:hypothetical protein
MHRGGSNAVSVFILSLAAGLGPVCRTRALYHTPNGYINPWPTRACISGAMGRHWIVSLCVLASALSSSAQSRPSDPLILLDHLAGDWVLKGTIGGKQTTHDVQAHWLLRREYLQLHEVSREKDANGEPAYEAVVLVSWDPKANQYACLWLDSTAGGALSSQVTCRANPSGDSIPFLFTISSSESIHTTFTYRKATDTWQWIIDDEANGKTERFADVELSRKK